MGGPATYASTSVTPRTAPRRLEPDRRAATPRRLQAAGVRGGGVDVGHGRGGRQPGADETGRVAFASTRRAGENCRPRRHNFPPRIGATRVGEEMPPRPAQPPATTPRHAEREEVP